jgi:hypothetical protein
MTDLERAYAALEKAQAEGQSQEVLRNLAEYARSLEQGERPILQRAGEAVRSGVDSLVGGAKDVARGALGSAEFYEKGAWAHPIGALALALRNRIGLKPPPVTEMLPVPENETPGDRLQRKALEGMGSSLLMPFGGPLAAAVTGAAGGVGGELGRRAGEALQGNSPDRGYAPLAGEITGALIGGGLTGFVTGPKQTLAEKHLRQATRHLGPDDWAQAKRNLADFEDVGARTATLGEAFPLNSAIMDLQREARSASVQNPLKIATEQRAADIQQLAKETLNRAGGPISIAGTANKLSDAANAVIDGTDRAGSVAVGNRLAGKVLPKEAVENVIAKLREEAAKEAKIQPVLAKAFRKVAKQLLDDEGEPLTNLQGISFQLKVLKESPVSARASNVKKGSDAVWRKAIGLAEEELGKRSQAFAAAMDDFALFQDQVAGPERAGLIGRLSDRNTRAPEFPTPTAKLDALVTGNLPVETRGAVRMLGEPRFAGQEAIPAEEIARAIIAKRLETAPVSPATAVRGGAGSDVEKQLAEILALGGRNPEQVLKPLAVAERLSGSQNPAGIKMLPEMRWWQLALRPFRTMDMMITGQGEEGMAQEIAKLLADPRRRAELEKIAKFDPTVRAMLATVPAVNAANPNGE